MAISSATNVSKRWSQIKFIRQVFKFFSEVVWVFAKKSPGPDFNPRNGLHLQLRAMQQYKPSLLQHIIAVPRRTDETTTFARELWYAAGEMVYTQSEIFHRGNVENDWNSSVVRRSPSKAIIGFPIISNYFQCRKCRFPDVGPRRKCQGFCALKSSKFRLKHALRNSLSMYFH